MMTHIGKSVFTIYSIVIVIGIIIYKFYKTEKGSDNAWEAVVLIPVLILLANLI